MTFIAYLLVCIGMILAPTGEAWASELTEAIRKLNMDQYRLAIGTAGSRDDVAKDMENVENIIAVLGAEDLANEQNAQATAIYLLSGGSFKALKASPERMTVVKSSALLSGALSYAEGQVNDAQALLNPLNPASFPPSLGGHVALAQAQYLLNIDKSGALRKLKFACLLMPDSLVEEAALRRQLLTLDPIRQLDQLERIGRRYSEKYSNSPYSTTVWSRLKEAVVSGALTVDYGRLAALESLLSNTSSSAQVQLHLSVARKAILSAKLQIARMEINKARDAATGQSEKLRVNYYYSLLDVISGLHDDASAFGNSKISSASPAEDQKLRHVVMKALDELPRAVRKQKLTISNETAGSSLGSGGDEAPPSVAMEAKRALSEAQDAISKSEKR